MSEQVLRRLYDAHAGLVVELFGPFEQGLTRLGLGNDRSYEFRRDTDAAVARILFPDNNAVAGVRFTGAQIANQRRARLYEFFVGLGVDERLATHYAQTLDGAATNNHNPDGSLKPGHQPWNVHMLLWWGTIFSAGRRTYEMLARIRRDASRSYEDAETTFELLARFPGLADAAYTLANIPGIEDFPPRPIGGAPTGDGAVIVAAYEEHRVSESREQILWAAGLAIVAIAATALSFGLLGPLAAAAIGAGLGAAQGGYMVYDAAAAVAEGQLAVAHGAMDEAELQRLENALTGAWRGLVIDMATGGLLGRFGGTRLLSSIVRGTLISGAGGGVATAADPNVWNAPNRVALIMEGFVIGAVVGGAGSGLGTGLAQALRRGTRVQVAIDHTQGPLTPGKTVHVSTGRDQAPLEGTVTAVDTRANTVSIAVGDETITVRPQKTIEITNRDGADPVEIRPREEAPVRPPPLVPDPELDRVFLNAADLRRLGVGNQRNGMASEYYTFQTGNEAVARHAILRPMAETNVNFGDYRISLWEGFAPMNYGRWIVVFRADQVPRVVHGNRRPEVEHHGNIDSPGLGYTNFDEARAAGLVQW